MYAHVVREPVLRNSNSVFMRVEDLASGAFPRSQPQSDAVMRRDAAAVFVVPKSTRRDS